VADEGGQELPDNATAERVAKQLAERLRGDLPQLRNRNFAVVVTDEDGERVCRIPIDLSNQKKQRIRLRCWPRPRAVARVRPRYICAM
jgi:hypothetical protein